jgi:hypothetical protein
VPQLASIVRRPAEGASLGREGVQERLERSRPGRALISLFVCVTLVAIAVTNLPDSSLRRTLDVAARPYLTATGLDQNWGVFAPDARRSVLSLVATVRYSDGSTAAWRIPTAGPALGAYWDYRWRKWAENVMTIGGGAAGLQRPAAVWIAREMQRPGKRPALVTLATGSLDLPPPGEGASGPARWREEVFYRLSFR